MRSLLVLLAVAGTAAADEIPTVTITDAGPDQEIPIGRSFYVAGTAARDTVAAQIVIAKKGNPRLLGSDGPDCATFVRLLRIDAQAHSAGDDDDDEDLATPSEVPTVRSGRHRAFELFSRADPSVRDAAILVTSAWRRTDENDRQYRVQVPDDRAFFSTGHSFCMVVVTADHQQIVEDRVVGESIDTLAEKLVDCADMASCDEDALDEYEKRLARTLSRARGPVNGGNLLAARLKEAARVELGTATGLVEARDRFEDKWRANITVIQPSVGQPVWMDISRDPFAYALTSLLARNAALLPQVTPKGVTLFTNDGKLAVAAVQVLDDGRSIRVAANPSPGDKARVLTSTTDQLTIADGLVLYDLIQLGAGKLRIDNAYISLDQIGQRLAMLGLEDWTAEDSAFLAGTLAHLRRIELYAEQISAKTQCPKGPIANVEAEHTPDSTNRHLGEWLSCRNIDLHALDTLVELLDDLAREEIAWREARDKLENQSRRIVTVTSSAALPQRISFEATPWLFSYVTPMLGAAGVMRTDETFGLFYLGAQIHLDPNPVDDVQWSDGITVKDLRRSIALELGVAPTGGGFGPDDRYSGPGRFPALFAGIAAHLVPYTSVSFGIALLDRKNSTLVEEDPRIVASPYVGVSLQLNLPDLIRRAAHPSSHTRAYP